MAYESNVPNLDAMDESELWAFWAKYQQKGKRSDCVELVGKRPRYTVIAANLGAYAANKATAMGCRIRGDISAALVYERICDNIYDGIPEDCRW